MDPAMKADTLELMLQRELPAASGGCTQAYGRIVAACQNTVTAIALAITRDVNASEDIAQEAFLKAWQQLGRLNNCASFLPWLPGQAVRPRMGRVGPVRRPGGVAWRSA